jgi:UDP-N-acetylglucosamine--N-acetylmuramyl-(pentapeptide) pyrophosphoryl-undecaprenol N-acetylglucosamine transferase
MLERFVRLRKPGRVVVEAFIDPIADAYAAADLVVSRSGGTVASLAAWGLPAVLVPLPSAAAAHQLSNARAAADAGAAVLLEQSRLTGSSLAETVNSLLADPARMAGIGAAALRRARPNAATEIASEALRLITKV